MTGQRRMRGTPRPAAVGLLGVAMLAAGLTACHVPPGFHDYTVFGGLNRPTAVEFSPDGRVFVAEKSGVIKVFDGPLDRTATVFADLRTKVFNGWDRGLLDIALHPNFPANPSVYALYTHDALPGGVAPRWGQPGADVDVCPDPPGDTDDGCVVTGRLSRLTAAGNTWTGTEAVLLQDWCQQYPSHSIGSLAFAPDGSLYASGGDGASWLFTDYGQDGNPVNPCGDPPGGVGGAMSPPTAEGGSLRAQDVRTSADPTGLDGTIVRINPDTGAAAPGNPFAGAADPNTRRIVAYGLRNPFRFTLRPGTDELWIGNVGGGTIEELNRSMGNDATADNFGWPCYEGPERFARFDSINVTLCETLYTAGTATDPYWTYVSDQPIVPGEDCDTGNGQSLSGVAFSPANGAYPDEYDGALFFADATRGCIWAMKAGSNGLPDPQRISTFVAPAGTPVELEVGPNGELWYVDLFGDAIHRIGYSTTNSPPTARIMATPASGDPPLAVAFSATSSTDPDPGDTLTFRWDLDGDGELDDSQAASPNWTYVAEGTVTVRLRATDAAGAVDETTFSISVGDANPPMPVIDTPTDGSAFAVGDAVGFSGHATDPDSGPVPASGLSWSVDLLHCPNDCHRHPDVFARTGVASGSFSMPDHEYPARLELHLTATSAGQSTTVTRVVDYQTAGVTFASDPVGVELSAGATTAPAPFALTLPIGGRVTITAPPMTSVGGEAYELAGWSDGGDPSHEIVVPAAGGVYTAQYVRAAGDAFVDGFDDGDTSDWQPLRGAWAPCDRPDTGPGYCGSVTTGPAATLAPAPAVADGTAEVTTRLPSTKGTAALTVRTQDSRTFVALLLERLGNGGARWQLQDRLADVVTTLASGALDPAMTTARLRLEASGADIVASLSTDGGATYTELGRGTTGLAGGRIGLRMTVAPAWFDDVSLLAP